MAWLERRPDCKRGGASVLPKYQGCNLGNGSVNTTTKTLHNVLWEFAQSILKQLLLKAKLPGSSSVIYTEEPTWQPHEVFLCSNMLKQRTESQSDNIWLTTMTKSSTNRNSVSVQSCFETSTDPKATWGALGFLDGTGQCQRRRWKW